MPDNQSSLKEHSWKNLARSRQIGRVEWTALQINLASSAGPLVKDRLCNTAGNTTLSYTLLFERLKNSCIRYVADKDTIKKSRRACVRSSLTITTILADTVRAYFWKTILNNSSISW